MTEKQFMNALKRELRGLSAEDRKNILDDCREHFLRGAEEGKSEADVAAALGSPQDLAEEAREELGIENFRYTPAGNVFRVSLAGLSLLLFNAIFVAGPFAGLVGGMAGLWAGAVSILVSGAAVVLAVPLEPFLRIWLPISGYAGVMPRFALFFAGIALVALGGLAVMGMVALTRLFVKGTVSYVRMTWRIISR